MLNRSPEAKLASRIKHHNSMIGEKNPMYGKNSEDFMTKEAIALKRKR